MSQAIAAVDAGTSIDFLSMRKRAILSAWAGFAVDSYSIYIVTSTLLPALIYFQGDMSAESKSIFAGMTLAVTLLGRPIGGLIFGHFADVLGRQRIGSITILGFGTVSLLVACLPGAELIGATWATSLLIALRLIEGIFIGGEYTAATPMALEYAPNARRGLVAGLVQCAASGGQVFVALINVVVLMVAPAAGLHSPYVQWGWRVPFFLGFFICWGVAVFLRRNVVDSDVWKSAAHAEGSQAKSSPLREMLRGESGKAFIQAYVFMSGCFFLAAPVSSMIPQFLLKIEGYTPSDLANTQIITSFVAMFSYIFFGWLSDHIGRKRALYLAGASAAFLAPFTMAAIGLGLTHDWLALTALSAATQFLYIGPFGVLPAYINERFATSVRSSGWGVAYSTAVIIPSFFPYYTVWLGRVIPFAFTPGVLMCFGGLLIITAAMFGPETRGIDLRAAGAADTRAGQAK